MLTILWGFHRKSVQHKLENLGQVHFMNSFFPLGCYLNHSKFYYMLLCKFISVACTFRLVGRVFQCSEFTHSQESSDSHLKGGCFGACLASLDLCPCYHGMCNAYLLSHQENMGTLIPSKPPREHNHIISVELHFSLKPHKLK